MNNIINFNEYKKEDYSRFYKELYNLVASIFENLKEENIDIDYILKVEFDKIIKKALNKNWLNSKLERHYVTDIKKYIEENSTVEYKFYYILTTTCLTDIFKDRMTNLPSNIKKALILALTDLSVSYSNYSKYVKVLLSEEIVNKLSPLDEETIKIIYKYLITELDFNKNISKIIKDSCDYIDEYKNDRNSKNVFKNYDINSIYEQLKKQMYTFDEVYRVNKENPNSQLVGLISRDVFEKQLKKLLKLEYLDEESKNGFLKVIENIDNKNFSLIEKINYIINMIDVYYEYLIQNGMYNINSKNRK